MSIDRNGRTPALVAGGSGAALFIVMFLLNDVIKPDYDPVRDAVSEAQIGHGGWLQSANFIVAGLLMASSSLAVSRVVNRWTGALVAVVGLGITVAGIFVSDPVPNTGTTVHGAIHNTSGTLSSVALIAACFTAARWRPTARWRTYCVAAGLAMPVLFLIGVAAPDTLGIWQRLTNIVGFTWLIALEMRAARALGPASS